MKSSSSNKFLFLLHMPPPVHGSSMVGLSIVESNLINDNFNCRFVNVLASKSIKVTGTISVYKIFGVIVLFLKIAGRLIFDTPKYCYFALTTTGFAFYRDFIIVVVLKLFRVRTIFHLHNKGISQRQGRLHSFLYSFTFKKSKVILLSPHLYRDIQAYVDEKDVFYCANGIESSSLLEVLKPMEKANKSSVRILYLSNLIESKGVFDLLEACSLLKKRGVSFVCEFIGGEGDIDQAQFYGRCKNLALEGNEVKYLGRKYGDEKDLAFLNADIFALPTYYSNECFPLVLLESMKFGLPSISCPEGGIADIVQDGVTGYLVKQRDAIALADRLEILINSKQLRDTMGKNAHDRFMEKFTYGVFEKTLTEILIEFVK